MYSLVPERCSNIHVLTQASVLRAAAPANNEGDSNGSFIGAMTMVQVVQVALSVQFLNTFYATIYCYLTIYLKCHFSKRKCFHSRSTTQGSFAEDHISEWTHWFSRLNTKQWQGVLFKTTKNCWEKKKSIVLPSKGNGTVPKSLRTEDDSYQQLETCVSKTSSSLGKYRIISTGLVTHHMMVNLFEGHLDKGLRLQLRPIAVCLHCTGQHP